MSFIITVHEAALVRALGNRTDCELKGKALHAYLDYELGIPDVSTAGVTLSAYYLPETGHGTHYVLADLHADGTMAVIHFDRLYSDGGGADAEVFRHELERRAADAKHEWHSQSMRRGFRTAAIIFAAVMALCFGAVASGALRITLPYLGDNPLWDFVEYVAIIAAVMTLLACFFKLEGGIEERYDAKWGETAVGKAMAQLGYG